MGIYGMLDIVWYVYDIVGIVPMHGLCAEKTGKIGAKMVGIFQF